MKSTGSVQVTCLVPVTSRVIVWLTPTKLPGAGVMQVVPDTLPVSPMSEDALLVLYDFEDDARSLYLSGLSNNNHFPAGEWYTR